MLARYVLSDYKLRFIYLNIINLVVRASCPLRLPFGETLSECKSELQSTLEDWILVGLKLGHTLPVIANINLNQE